MEDHEARVNVTYNGHNGDLPDPVEFQATTDQILGWVSEAIRAGSIPGIPADANANLVDFMVDRIAPSEAFPYSRLLARPKTPFGQG